LSWKRSGRAGNASLRWASAKAVEVPFAGESSPAGEDGRGDDLAPTEGRLGAGSVLLPEVGLAEVVNHDIQCGEEGVHADHMESAPFPVGSANKPTLGRGHLPLNFRASNSHQASKPCGKQAGNLTEEVIMDTMGWDVEEKEVLGVKHDVTFPSQGLECAGWLYVPDDLGSGQQLPGHSDGPRL
jgi:hypothetical protein